jgi:DNA-binding NarL/FixJ family response regulator
MISILIADSSNLSLPALVSILADQPDLNIVCQTNDSDELITNIHNHQPDVVIMDIQLNPAEMVNAISTYANTRCRFLIVTDESSEPSTIIRLLRAGAHGFIQMCKGKEYLLQSIRDIASNSSPVSPELVSQLMEYVRNTNETQVEESTNHPKLSQREYLVLGLLHQGLSNKIIGNQLKISERTVEAHVRNIFKKLNASSRTQAVFLASKNGWFRNDK